MVENESWVEFALDAAEKGPAGAVEGEVVEGYFGEFGGEGELKGEEGQGDESVGGVEVGVDGFLLHGGAM